MKFKLTIILLFVAIITIGQDTVPSFAPIKLYHTLTPLAGVPVAETNDITGSVKAGANLAALQALNVNLLTIGTLGYAEDTDKWYMWDGVSTWDVYVGGGKWLDGTGGIYYSSDVGIGTIEPSSSLDIVGDIEATENIYIQNSDPYNLFWGVGETKPASATGALNISMGYHNMGSAPITSANNNITIGHENSTDMTEGEHNIAIGNQSFRNNTTGGYNVAVGTDAMAFNTTADDNTAVGHKALNKNETSWYNTAIGYRAWESSLGVGNTGVGNAVGNKTITGFHNSVFGTWAFYENRYGVRNTIVGTRAGFNYMDSLAVIIGYRSAHDYIGSGILSLANGGVEDSTFIFGDSNHQIGIGTITPSSKLDVVGDFQSTENIYLQNADQFSLFIGAGATKPASLTGGFNLSIGVFGFAFSSATTAENNIHIGNFSGGAQTTGKKNTSIGNQSLGSNTSGDENTVAGQLALSSNTTGNSNTSVGVFSLGNNVSGNLSTAVGYYALQLNLASFNTAIGANASVGNTTGTSNTAVGVRALAENRNGAGNTVVGTDAAHSLLDSLSVVIGFRALYDSIQGTHMALANGATKDSVWIYGNSIHNVLVPNDLKIEGATIMDGLVIRTLVDSSNAVYKINLSEIINSADTLSYIWVGYWKKL